MNDGKQGSELVDSSSLPAALAGDVKPELPAISIEVGAASVELQDRVHQFYGAVPFLFEQWIGNHESHHTQRTYRRAVMNFVGFMAIAWPHDGYKFLAVTTRDVQRWRSSLLKKNQAIAAVSGFYEYLRKQGAEHRVPVQVPNPADKDFVERLDDHPKHPRTYLELEDVRTRFRPGTPLSMFEIRRS